MVADLAGVGENFQEHYGSISLFWKLNCTDCALDEEIFASPLSYQQWNTSGKGVLTLPFGAEIIGYINTKYASKAGDWPDIQLLCLSPISTAGFATAFGEPKEILDELIKPLGNNRKLAIVPYLMRPKSRGSIKLQSNSPFDDPLIDFNFSHPDDIETLLQGMKMAIAIGNSKALKSLGAELSPYVLPRCQNHSFISDKYLECLLKQMTNIYFHAAGTCKMGLTSDPMAVVDNNLYVYKVKRLRIVDASIMPTIASGNTNAPTIMIAEKASDFIKNQYSI